MAETNPNWWNSLDSDTRQALILAGAGAGSAYFNNRAEEGREDDRRADSAITNQAEGIQSILGSETGDFQFNANRNDSNAANAARMSGNSPLQFQADRARMSAMRDVLGGAGQAQFSGMPGRYAKHMPTMGSTPFSAQTMGFMDGGAMAAAEKPYWAAQQNIDPRLKSPDLGAMGYGAAGTGVTAGLEEERAGRLADRQKTDAEYNTKADARRVALMQALNQLGPEGEDKKKKSGSDWWKKAALLGAGAAGGYYFG